MQDNNIIFEDKELKWIKELVEDKIAEMKQDGDYDFFKYDKEIFESILNKVKNI